MKTRDSENPYSLARIYDEQEELRKMIWGLDYQEREQRSAYLRGLIEQQARDPRAGKEQRAL